MDQIRQGGCIMNAWGSLVKFYTLLKVLVRVTKFNVPGTTRRGGQHQQSDEQQRCKEEISLAKYHQQIIAVYLISHRCHDIEKVYEGFEGLRSTLYNRGSGAKGPRYECLYTGGMQGKAPHMFSYMLPWQRQLIFYTKIFCWRYFFSEQELI